MKKIIIAGAGGIGRSVALLLAQWSDQPYEIYIGDGNPEAVKEVVAWLKTSITKPNPSVYGFEIPYENISEEMKSILTNGDVILDCLPGKLAPKIARLADTYGLHYANLTEYVKETNEIISIANQSSNGFILQTGLAPGFINILAHALFNKFCNSHKVDQADRILMVVGAITQTARAPHYYGFTWSPIGVATEYLEPANVLRNYKKEVAPALSDRETIIIGGTVYEIDITSGGAADLPGALEGKVKTLDYKTLRYPGHYAWVEDQLKEILQTDNRSTVLQHIMEQEIPRVEDDVVVIYCSVTGKDDQGIMQEEQRNYRIFPTKVGNTTLKSIQVTTAAPLAQMAELLLTNTIKGPLLQSEIDENHFFNGTFVRKMLSDQ